MAHRKKSSGITYSEWQSAIDDAEKSGGIPPDWISTRQLAKVWGLSSGAASSILQNFRESKPVKFLKIRNGFLYHPDTKKLYVVGIKTPGSSWVTAFFLEDLWKIDYINVRKRLQKLRRSKLIECKVFKLKQELTTNFVTHYRLKKKYLSWQDFSSKKGRYGKQNK